MPGLAELCFKNLTVSCFFQRLKMISKVLSYKIGDFLPIKLDRLQKLINVRQYLKVKTMKINMFHKIADLPQHLERLKPE